MSRLPQKPTDGAKRIAVTDDYIPAYCIVGQISDPTMASGDYEDEMGPFSTTKEPMEAQANDLLCLNRRGNEEGWNSSCQWSWTALQKSAHYRDDTSYCSWTLQEHNTEPRALPNNGWTSRYKMSVRCSQKNIILASNVLQCTRILVQGRVLQTTQAVANSPTIVAVVSIQRAFDVCRRWNPRTANKKGRRKPVCFCYDGLLQQVSTGYSRI